MNEKRTYLSPDMNVLDILIGDVICGSGDHGQIEDVGYEEW